MALTHCTESDNVLAEFKKVPDDEKGPVFKTLLKGPLSLHLPRFRHSS